ncbi:hypothetical protein MTR67_028906 [Solanum verrucosum]|uniref:Uncharacterized protein n=1 Tax=Solanum verrucosum TaxID=315347 RepID=A0AAF0R4X5_SOLVR|nr:hypothetical protein MTR67_028906 [Solanum verrucosum]
MLSNSLGYIKKQHKRLQNLPSIFAARCIKPSALRHGVWGVGKKFTSQLSPVHVMQSRIEVEMVEQIKVGRTDSTKLC